MKLQCNQSGSRHRKSAWLAICFKTFCQQNNAYGSTSRVCKTEKCLRGSTVIRMWKKTTWSMVNSSIWTQISNIFRRSKSRAINSDAKWKWETRRRTTSSTRTFTWSRPICGGPKQLTMPSGESSRRRSLGTWFRICTTDSDLSIRITCTEAPSDVWIKMHRCRHSNYLMALSIRWAVKDRRWRHRMISD